MGEKKKKRRWYKVFVATVAAVVAVFSVVSLIFIKLQFDDVFKRTVEPKYSAYLRYEDVADQYERELIRFRSGKNELQGYHYGIQNAKGIVVIAHGQGGGAENYFPETMYFVDHGYQVFAYDNTGCFQSEGKSGKGLSQSVLDLDAALTFLEGEERFAGLPVFLYGHSWGGYAVTAIFGFDHNITASVSLSGYNRPVEMAMSWGEGMLGSFISLEYPFLWLYEKTVFGKYGNLAAVDGLNRTNTPVLVIHGTGDEVIPIDGPSVLACREEITNPNVQYKIYSEEGHNGHNNLKASAAGIAYRELMNEEYAALYEEYGGEIPDEANAAWYGLVDKRLASELDETFMGDLLQFYEDAVVRGRD